MYINGTRRVSTMRWNSKSSFFLSNFEVLTQSFLVSGIHSYQQVVDSVKTFSTFWLEKTLRRQTAKFHLLTLFSYSLSTFCLGQKYFIKITLFTSFFLSKALHSSITILHFKDFFTCKEKCSLFWFSSLDMI